MSEIDQLVITPLERAMNALPGGSSPYGRMAWGAGIGAGVSYGLKPSLMFYNGEPRPWALTSSAPHATWFPVGMGIALPAIFLGVFV